MPSVAAYQAGLETTNTSMSYAAESTWATLPVAPFKGMRIISESLKHVKTRTRPAEIRGDRQAAPGLTTQEAASGTVVFPVFYTFGATISPFEDWMSCLLGGDWQGNYVTTGASGDITLTWDATNLVANLTSTTANKFALAQVGQIIKLNGFTNTVNNSFFRIVAIISSSSLKLAPQGVVPVTETPAGSAAQFYMSALRNGPYFKSLYLQQRLDPAGSMWFRYPGAYPTRAQISLSLGQFMQASFDVSCQQELKGLADASTGGVAAPPNTRDMDPVGGFKGIYFSDQLLSSACDQVNLDFSNDGAAGQYALGSALAQGMLGGTFTASGTFRIYIKDFSLYTAFRAETPGVLSMHFGDQQGNRYVITAPNTLLLLNNGVSVDGPNKSLMGEFTAEMSPDTASGMTVNIDRFPYNV